MKFVLTAHHDEAYKLPAPPQDGTLATDYLMLHILIPQIPVSIDEYLKRGFSWDEIKESLRSYSGCIYMVGVLTGRPGDGCLNVHIPKGSDISEQTFRAACDSARKIMKERYSEHGGGNIFAYSWIFDPMLTELLGEHSTISKFQNFFARFPICNNGRAAFNFVFPGYADDFTKLPENTSLQRKIKAMYLNGKYIYEYAGAIFEEE